MSTKADGVADELSDMNFDFELTPLANDDIQLRRRLRKPTEAGRAYQIERKEVQCKSIQRRITRIMEKFETEIEDYNNVHTVQSDFDAFIRYLVEFQDACQVWRDLLSEEKLVSVVDWYDEQWRIMTECKSKITNWIAEAKQTIEEQLDAKSGVSKSSIGSHRSRGSTHSSISSKVREKAKVAELKAKAALLDRKQALENEAEKLRLQEELAIAQAREKVYSQIDTKREAATDGMNEYLENVRPVHKENTANELLKSEPISRSVTTGIHQLTPISAFHSKRASWTPVTLPPFSPPRSSDVISPPHLPGVKEPILNYGRESRPPPDDSRDRITLNSDPLLQLLERQNRLTEILAEQHQQSLLPSLSLSRFKGDPTEYHVFMRTFESRIENSIKSSEARMQYLEQYLEGEPKQLINGCHHMEPHAGYVEAKRLLNEKYGDPYKVSNAYLKKVTDWPTLKSGDDDALERLAIFLTQCHSAMGSLSYLIILDHPQNLQSLVKKLPFYLQERWRREVTKIRERNKIPMFKDLVNFVKSEAKVATDPVFSRQALDRVGQEDKAKTKKLKPSRVINNATVTSERSRSCIVCNAMHDLDECKAYLKKTLSERRALIAKRGLCYACYGHGHRSRGCIQRRTCKLCSGRHPTGLHDEDFCMKNRKDNANNSKITPKTGMKRIT